MIIPVILIFFIQNKPGVPFLPVFWLFGAFILLCGTTHAIDALLFWWPGYRVSALVRFMTAVVSMATVFALIRDLPKALNITTAENHKRGADGEAEVGDSSQIEREIEALKAEIVRLDELKAARSHGL